jgi:hypothetical protein
VLEDPLEPDAGEYDPWVKVSVPADGFVLALMVSVYTSATGVVLPEYEVPGHTGVELDVPTGCTYCMGALPVADSSQDPALIVPNMTMGML